MIGWRQQRVRGKGREGKEGGGKGKRKGGRGETFFQGPFTDK